MRRATAEKLITIDFSTLPQHKQQAYKVQLLDAWRYARGDYGHDNDFFIAVPELNAYVPKNYWLLKNIESRLDQIGL